MGPDATIRDGQRALELAEKVFAARPESAHAEVVAAALAELGHCSEAAEWQRRALELASSGEPAAQRRVVLALYAQGPPCAYPAR